MLKALLGLGFPNGASHSLAHAATPQTKVCATKNKTARARPCERVPLKPRQSELAYLTFRKMMANV
jgi:hypothetical protein